MIIFKLIYNVLFFFLFKIMYVKGVFLFEGINFFFVYIRVGGIRKKNLFICIMWLINFYVILRI